MLRLKKLLILLALIVLLPVSSLAESDSFIRFLIPFDFDISDCHEITLTNTSDDSERLYYYYKPQSDVTLSNPDVFPVISLSEAFKKTHQSMMDILHTGELESDQYKFVYRYDQPQPDNTDGSYYQFNVLLQRPDRIMYIFFIDAMTGEFMSKPLYYRVPFNH